MVLIAILLSFAVVVHQWHVGLYAQGQLAGVLGVAGGGGELFVLSVFVAVLVGAVRAARSEDPRV